MQLSDQGCAIPSAMHICIRRTALFPIGNIFLDLAIRTKDEFFIVGTAAYSQLNQLSYCLFNLCNLVDRISAVMLIDLLQNSGGEILLSQLLVLPLQFTNGGIAGGMGYIQQSKGNLRSVVNPFPGH